MCEQCSAATKTYGEVVPQWWLVQATREGNMMKVGDFGLVTCNDPDYIWPLELAPRKDPAFGMDDERFDNMTDQEGRAWDEFEEYVEKLSEHFSSDPMTGYCLMGACFDAGYNRAEHGWNYMGWLAHKMAVVMERNPTADETICEQYALQDEAAWGYSRDEHGTIRKHQDGT